MDMKVTDSERIMVEAIRGVNFHPCHALAALNNTLSQNEAFRKEANKIADAIVSMGEDALGDGVLD
ncbi:hypothetical protein ACTFR8_24105 [Bacillus cereus group sp. MYBK15-3]|uniref:hypothetical protein n=1 Tax=Bacillus cereus group TaxID=86661 RepID=UPI001C8C0020|nr:hypothetical protein [Bacillus cereus]MBX9158684.1 hypothetical protein [Bacillus cereus]